MWTLTAWCLGALEVPWAPDWQFPWSGDSPLSAVASCWGMPSAVYVFHIFFLLICSSVWIQLTNFPVENLLRCGSLWAIWKIRTEHLLKCWRLQPRHGKLFSAIFNFLNWRQRVNPAAQWSWSNLSNLNSLTFLHNYRYKMLLNAENMLGFYFFFIKVKRLKTKREREMGREGWKLMQLNCSFQQPQESSAMKMTFPYNWHFPAGAILWFAAACVRRPSWRGSFSFSYPSNGI